MLLHRTTERFGAAACSCKLKDTAGLGWSLALVTDGIHTRCMSAVDMVMTVRASTKMGMTGEPEGNCMSHTVCGCRSLSYVQHGVVYGHQLFVRILTCSAAC